MKQLLLAAALIGAFTAPAFAMAGPFYIMFDNDKGTCSMATKVPSDTDKFAMMGTYKTEKDAHMAMEGMTKCHK
ncbi:hypothetical protein A7A08_02566 [Methyloligella halotolerans]|uniref:Uncharacterized protein n=1 Tax=Methyloligella halotolerans TaxID=1177755 RepID=A0A1E2RW34_9HYPH|nr:hypothetical protein [Methyloligella halotolerans]ODA66444.1 hypothetical protein A7A08_02566 [Methyloligella halotolerans]